MTEDGSGFVLKGERDHKGALPRGEPADAQDPVQGQAGLPRLDDHVVLDSAVERDDADGAREEPGHPSHGRSADLEHGGARQLVLRPREGRGIPRLDRAGLRPTVNHRKGKKKKYWRAAFWRLFFVLSVNIRKGKRKATFPKKNGMLRVADRIKKWGTMATGMLDRSKGGMLSTAGKLAAGGALLTLGIGALHVARAKAREDFNAGAASLIKELREELEKAKELQKTLNSRCEELGAKPCGIEPSAAAVEQSDESAGFKRALKSVQERIDTLDKDVNSLRGEAIPTASTVRELGANLGSLRRDLDSSNRNIQAAVQNADAHLSQYEQSNRESLRALELNIQERIQSLTNMIASVSSSTGAANEEAIAKVEGLEASLRTAITHEVLKIASANSTGNELESRLKEVSAMEERLKHLVEAIDRWEANLGTVHTLLAESKDKYHEMDERNHVRLRTLEEAVETLEAALDARGEHSFGSSAHLLPTLLSALGAVSSGGREKIAAKIVDVLVAQAALHRSADPRVHALYTE